MTKKKIVKSKRKKKARKKPAKRSAKRKTKRNSDLLTQVCRLTGIPGKSIKDELKNIIEEKNLDMNNLTLDQLRQVAASYLREIMSSLIDRSNQRQQSN